MINENSEEQFLDINGDINKNEPKAEEGMKESQKNTDEPNGQNPQNIENQNNIQEIDNKNSYNNETEKKDNLPLSFNDSHKKYKEKIEKISESDEQKNENFLNSFLVKIKDINDAKIDYEKQTQDFKYNFYKCKCKNCKEYCGVDCYFFTNCLDCFCCNCCSNCCVNRCKDEKHNRNEIINFREKNDELIKSLDDLKVNYIQHYKQKKEKIQRKCKYDNALFFYLIFSFLSFIHFFLIAEIQSFLFSLEREVSRTIYHHFFEKYREDDVKDFMHFLQISSTHDSSQINLNYVSSFFTELFVSKTSIFIVYLISVFGIMSVLGILRIIDFLPLDVIENNTGNYSIIGTVGLCLLYILIYIFTGIISLYPLYIIKQHTNYFFNKTVFLVSIFLTLGICLKFFINGNEGFSFDTHLIIIGCGEVIILICLFVINRYYLNKKIKKAKESIKKDNKNEDIERNNNNSIIDVEENTLNDTINENSSYYILGHLIIGNEFMKVTIKIRSMFSDICSIFWPKLFFILFINFFGRSQKLKFKIDYKNQFKDFQWTILNFIISLVFYFILYSFICTNCFKKESEEEKGEENCNTEKIIIIGLGIENIIIMVLSILSYNYDCCVISFLSIAVSGCFNFILYEYYSTVQVEYVTISGFISFPQLIFRLIELYCKFNEDWWYSVQFGCGFIGLVFNMLYLIY